MDKRTEIIQEITSKGLLPLYFHADPETSAGVLEALYQAGIRTIEYTNRGPEALGNFEILKTKVERALPGMWLGIGTIKDASAARDFIEAGADFLISPGIPEDVFDEAYSEKILWIPGCMTVTEIMQAEQFGISFIKIFPGNILGPGFIQAIREIFPALSFMPTGGVELEEGNLRNWFASGIAAVGMGSKLITKGMLSDRNYKGITQATRQALDMIQNLRK
ncbi:MAG: bifunctional 4-hydroxy-2-oxoglutarate aldolase/2-dehydro-3-deoxy-phosphogluconate aldolase [Chitinophagales bacterium]